MGSKITVAIAGLGRRGRDAYAITAKQYADKMEIVAIADIIPEKVDIVAKEYGIPREFCFTSAEEMLEQEKLADMMIIATQDQQHVPHALPALRKGYHLLLEKPISPDLDECKEIIKVAQEYNREVIVCHVLRYTPFYLTIKKLIDEGKIGDCVSVLGVENVGYWHHAHSFVRGNWRNSDITSPMILQKCCHDMDIFLWLTGKTCESVSSFGSNHLFKAECAPKGATPYCLGGCKAKESCEFDAEKIYITNKRTGKQHNHMQWMHGAVSLHPTEENLIEELKTGPYGRCVYACDNNVVDHQVVNLNMTDGTTVHLTMCSFTEKSGRSIKVMGTKGEIIADMPTGKIILNVFNRLSEEIDVSALVGGDATGHAGGDYRMVEQFLDLLLGNKEKTPEMTSIEYSVESHYCAMAAEKSRINGGAVVSLAEMRK